LKILSKGENMNNSEFKQNALRTESMDFEKIKARLSYAPVGAALLIELQRTVEQLQKLDSLKKYLFYGKESQFLVDWEKNHWPMISAAHENPAELMTQAKRVADVLSNIRLLHGVIGLNTEGGELIEAFLKVTRGEFVDGVNFMEEVGDVNWYEAIIADVLMFEVDEANERVIAKLKARFPDKFTESNAINRDLGTERQILEGQQ